MAAQCCSHLLHWPNAHHRLNQQENPLQAFANCKRVDGSTWKIFSVFQIIGKLEVKIKEK